MKSQKIAVLDFGSQYTQVIARRIRECNVYSKIFPYNVSAETLQKEEIQGLIFSGGPASVLAEGAPKPDPAVFDLEVPILGICYGVQLIAHMMGGEVSRSDRREYGHGTLRTVGESRILASLPKEVRVWNSHGDRIIRLPDGFRPVAETENSEYAGIEHADRAIFGLQFHPEVSHTECGSEILRNFLIKVCGCTGDWSMANFIERSVEDIREAVGDEHVVLGLSGGVDSSVAAALIHKAVGKQLTCVFVDNGLLRLNEKEQVELLFRENFAMDLRVEEQGDFFLERLKGVEDPEEKRKKIGNAFVEVFEMAIQKIGEVTFLAQGTLYPDVIESVSIDGNPAALIKSHHNVGGLPEKMRLKLLEPLRNLFKDEVRLLGQELGLPKEVLWRQPFPGPGLGVRVLGEVKEEYLETLRRADAILTEEMYASDFYYKVWQSFCVFLPVRTVGVMGDERTYDHVVALRIVESADAMTADWARMPHDLIRKISNRIINEVDGVNRVVLDVSSKPPSTIEWE
ncbi:MAG: glutamine-hydrolyzing GMP synthase [Verrucomicrobiota bacterium]